MIYQGEAFNGKPTKTARSHGKKFQVSVKQETSRLLVRTFLFYLKLVCVCACDNAVDGVGTVRYACETRTNLLSFMDVTGEFGVGLHAEIQFHDGGGGL